MSIYELRARYTPAVVAALPIIVLSGFVKREVWITLFQNVECFLVVENISLSLIAVRLLIHVQRGISKHLFEDRIFDSGKEFPTTRMLLFSDERLSHAMKSQVREKIRQDFGLALLEQDQEKSDPDEARKVIRDAVALVRHRVGDGVKVLQYNIHYGFSRNLIGGAVLAAPGSALCAVLAWRQNNTTALALGLAMLVAYVALLVLSKPILVRFGNAYAERLFTEFLTVKEGTER